MRRQDLALWTLKPRPPKVSRPQQGTLGQAWTERNLKTQEPNQAGVIRGALAKRTIQPFGGLRGTESSHVTQARLELQILSPLSAGITSICHRLPAPSII